MKTVIFVDDEVSVLEGLRRSLRRRRSEWDMHYFYRAEDAVEYIKDHNVDVVVSDMRMPGMNGAEFLQAVHELRPNAIRLALSGYADSQLILESAHAIHQHISKPADIDTITGAIDRSLQLHAQLDDPVLHHYVGGLSSLPAMPHVYDEIMQLFAQDSYSQADIAAIIEKDIGFSTTVLRIVNSDFFGTFGNIGSIGHAVNMLGTETLKNIVLSENLFTQFAHAETDELERLNTLTKSVSALAHKFARTAELGDRERDHTQMAGMVCTVGDMVILDAGDPGEHISPEMISAHMLNLWSMPDSIVEAVLTHREPVMPDDVASETPTVAGCLRAAWYAGNNYLLCDDTTRQDNEDQLSQTLRTLAGNNYLADKWYDTLATTMV